MPGNAEADGGGVHMPNAFPCALLIYGIGRQEADKIRCFSQRIKIAAVMVSPLTAAELWYIITLP